MVSLNQDIWGQIDRLHAEVTDELEFAEELYKVVLIGNSGVGKTSMLKYLLNGESAVD